MAKLYFRYGAVGSAKTMNLLAVAHNYTQQGKRPLLLKPELDDRFGVGVIRSRSGLERNADVLLGPDSTIDASLLDGVDVVLVDEAQFLSPAVIDQLRDVATFQGIPVICYGLRTDFRRNLFGGSRRLLELADSVEEVKSTCAFCDRKAVFNLKFVGGQPSTDGPTIDLGAEEKYMPACSGCYKRKLDPLGSGRLNELGKSHLPEVARRAFGEKVSDA